MKEAPYALHRKVSSDLTGHTIVVSILKAPPLNDFKSKHSHVEDLSMPVRRAIESVQPYNRAHALMPPLPAVLRDFDDADKHRLIKVAAAA